jgi:hypothetical protein
MSTTLRSLGLLTLAAALAAACATAEVRPSRSEERIRTLEAFAPLLDAAYGTEAVRCHVVTGVLEADRFDAWIRAEPGAACRLAVVVTTRAVDTLTPRALQMLLAHELGHVQSRHAMGRARVSEIQGSRTDTGHRSRLQTGRQQFNPAEESDADAAAAQALTRAWRGGNTGCLGLADFYEGIAGDRRPWGEWLSRHPFPERRIDAVVKVCEEEQRRAR